MGDSLFDILGPVMIGPSSSHTAGAVRLANLARLIAENCDKKIQFVEFELYNSFAKTYRGHGTDRGLLAGILGYTVHDDQIRDAFKLAEARQLRYAITPVDQPNHYSPNTVVFKILLEPKPGEEPEALTIVGHSIGGGKVYLSRINGYNVTIRGELPTLLLFYKDQPGMIWQVTRVLAEQRINIATLACTRLQRNIEAFMTIALDELPCPEAVAEIRRIPDMYEVWCIDRLAP